MKRNYYIFKSGEIKRKDNSIEVILSNGDKKLIPVEDVDTLFIMGENVLNTKFINFASQKGIVMHFFNYYGFYTGSFYPKDQLNSGMVLVKQVEHYLNKRKRVILAREILKSGVYGIYRNLRYYNERGRDLSEEIKNINILREKLDNQNKISELMGIEGNIREIYYKAFNKIVNQEIDFVKRVKRPPDNMINSMISFVNSLVYTVVLSEIYHTQLSPLISYLHEPGSRRFSLSLDIAEIFKPLIGDRLIFSLLNKNQITEKDFEKNLNFLYLKERARRVILQEYDNKLKSTIRHKTLKKNVSYRYLIRLEMYKIVKHLLEEKQYKGFKIWW
ncbi:type I-B CRISPR-associated endonuclease Cas1b [Defluviitalea phaphyphila]|uniref:type I-B CRISPR-associated endonuclease Cas1b n=1 Tax=Defluviitalea phaphyphila TaxID=1473580 RepID=UPI0007318BD6|nr:type I-B CRISPR-associated endonuclease Cas1b [Defluviitalea phaphyphila]